MTPERRSYLRADVPLPVGRLLRLELHHDGDGEPETLVIATGWGDPALPDPEKTLSVPAASLSDVRAALAALDNPNTETDR